MTVAVGFFIGLSVVVWIGLLWKIFDLECRVSALEDESYLEKRRRAYNSVNNVLPFRPAS